MPATSRAQYRLMRAVASGDAHLPGMTKKQGEEYVAGQSPKGLPERKKPKTKTEYDHQHMMPDGRMMEDSEMGHSQEKAGPGEGWRKAAKPKAGATTKAQDMIKRGLAEHRAKRGG